MKTKLIIACLIVAAAIAGFTYFFILIGEQAMRQRRLPHELRFSFRRRRITHSLERTIHV